MIKNPKELNSFKKLYIYKIKYNNTDIYPSFKYPIPYINNINNIYNINCINKKDGYKIIPQNKKKINIRIHLTEKYTNMLANIHIPHDYYHNLLLFKIIMARQKLIYPIELLDYIYELFI